MVPSSHLGPQSQCSPPPRYTVLTPSAGNSSTSVSSSIGTTMRARLAPRAASFYRKEAGLLLAGGRSCLGTRSRWGRGVATVLGHQWAWVPRASPEPTHLAMHSPIPRPGPSLLRGCKASALEASHLHRALRVQCIGVLIGLHLCLGLTLQLQGRGKVRRRRCHSPLHPCRERRAMAPTAL